jgi:hypothetical protein
MGCGPPIDVKMGLSGACTLMERGRQRSVYTLDEARPFLSLIRNARFEPICVAPLLGVSHLLGASGLRILHALAKGETDPRSWRNEVGSGCRAPRSN